MATGAPGTNGVWLYGEDDSEATFSTLLNKAGTTVNTQIGLDRARLTALEASGRIVQVVTATYTTETTTSSSSFVTSGLTATITPKSATNKILVLTSATMSHNDERDASIATLFRGTVAGTNLGNGVNGMAAIRNAITGASNTRSTFGINYLDSPATTSATTYTLGFRTTAIQAKIQVGSATSVMTLLEVVA